METTKVKKKAGRISPAPMGDYDNTTTYRRLDWVYYGGTSYICKKNNTLGISPTDTDKWQKIIELPTELNMIFDEATKRENISSGEKLSVILGKIKKCISDIKTVAFTGSYNDLLDTPQSLKNPNSLNVKLNGISAASYDGSEAKEINVTPSAIAAVPTVNILSSKEQVLANTNANNIANAIALKDINADLVNSINQINSKLTVEKINFTYNENFADADDGMGNGTVVTKCGTVAMFTFYFTTTKNIDSWSVFGTLTPYLKPIDKSYDFPVIDLFGNHRGVVCLPVSGNLTVKPSDDWSAGEKLHTSFTCLVAT